LRVPLSWLSDYVDLPLDPEDLAERLTIAGAEVGEILSTGGDWEGVTVARVLDVARHPNADRLVLATVELGGGGRQTVVCGAPNVAAGQKVPFAPAGTRLVDGRTGKSAVLKAAVIRGVESAGMILSEKELGISDSHEGILVLGEEAEVGRPLTSVLSDVIFDFDLTPNRADLLSVVGIAREAAALTDQRVRDPSIEYPELGPPIKGRVRVEILDPDLCPRYCAALIENVRMGESPPWMQERLTAAGMRPINNIVDITNYVMLEMGQPLHAFDYEKIPDKTIAVRRPQAGERLLLLDGRERELSAQMLAICDSKDPIAVAGVMGGADTEVDLNTKSVLLEAANFHGPNIRRTARTLRIRSDASSRFEKGLSPQLPVIAAQRAVKLMVELCGGQAAKGLVDVFPGKRKDVRITLPRERLQRVLGVDLPTTRIRQVLSSLGFGCRWMPPDRFVIRVPYWRTDIAIADDIIEEVARVTGYDQLPTNLLRGELPTLAPQPRLRLRERVSDSLVSAGLQEVVTYSLTSLETLRKVIDPEELAQSPPLRVANPISRELEYARTTLRASLLTALQANTRHNPGVVSLFEAARTYLPRSDDLPTEVQTACAVMSGRFPDRWGQPTGDPAGFFNAKACVEHIMRDLRIPIEFQDTTDFAYLPGSTAAVMADAEQVGLVGQVHPRVTAAFEISSEVAMIELDLNALLPHVPGVAHYQPVPAFPSVDQDMAIIVPQSVSAATVLEIIRSFKLVGSVSVFDVYSGAPIAEGKKSLAFSVTFQAMDHTLTDAEVSHQRERIMARLRQRVDAELRS
jgi:phenylalanyl-tRNA synthetase beta chain